MYEVSTGVRSTRNEDGGVVLDIGQGLIFRLNSIGVLILEFIHEGLNETDIAREVARRYNVNIKEVETDVRDFLEMLRKHHLIRMYTGTGDVARLEDVP